MTERDGSAKSEVPTALGTICRPLESKAIFQGLKEVYIQHGGELYRLTITRNDRLILQK